MMRLIALLGLFSALNAHAEGARFTTVFLDDEGVVYVGMKHGDPALSEIVSFPFQSGERTNIPLPAAIGTRDVIGLLTEKEKLFVLTAPLGLTPTDGPMLYVYDREKSKWEKVGGVACPTFTKVTLKSNQMIFSCEVGKAHKGKTHVVRKTIALRKNHIYRNGVWRFPEFLLRFKGRTVLLEGLAPTWDRLRLRAADNSERTIAADDLLQLPLPGMKAAPSGPEEPIPPESTGTSTDTDTDASSNP